MDPGWLRHLAVQGRESLAGTTAEWDAFDRYAAEREADWRDSAGRAVAQGPVAELRSQAQVLRTSALSHMDALDAMAVLADGFVRARAEHDEAGAASGRAQTAALADLDEGVRDAARACRHADASTAAAAQAGSIVAQLQRRH